MRHSGYVLELQQEHGEQVRYLRCKLAALEQQVGRDDDDDDEEEDEEDEGLAGEDLYAYEGSWKLIG